MRRRKFLVATICLVIVLPFWNLWRQTPTLNVWMLDVGQGESVLIQEPQGRTLLFDGGPDDKVLSQLGAVLPFWQRDIDLVVLSHTHADHISGLVNVLNRYKVHEVWISGDYGTIPEFREFTRLTAEQKIPVRHRYWNDAPCAETCPIPESFGAAKLQLYHPMQDMAGKQPKDRHDADLVVKVSYGMQSILLTGDLDEQHERDMLTFCQPPSCSLRATVLQEPHHGSVSGLLPAFLTAVSPEIDLIPVGIDNMYNHPSPKTLQKLKNAKIPVYRTDFQGRIHVKLDGFGITVERERDG